MSFTVVKNLTSGVLFVLVKVHEDKKLTILNPEGKQLIVPPGLFDIPFLLKDSSLLTQAQVEAWDKFMKASVSKPTNRSVVRKKSSSDIGTQRLFLDKEWFSEKLTFYKHNIEPLNSRERFRIHVENVGIFEFSKEAFDKHFNDVAIAKTYWQEGFFSYELVPDKALKYLVSTHKKDLE